MIYTESDKPRVIVEEPLRDLYSAASSATLDVGPRFFRPVHSIPRGRLRGMVAIYPYGGGFESHLRSGIERYHFDVAFANFNDPKEVDQASFRLHRIKQKRPPMTEEEMDYFVFGLPLAPSTARVYHLSKSGGEVEGYVLATKMPDGSDVRYFMQTVMDLLTRIHRNTIRRGPIPDSEAKFMTRALEEIAYWESLSSV